MACAVHWTGFGNDFYEKAIKCWVESQSSFVYHFCTFLTAQSRGYWEAQAGGEEEKKNTIQRNNMNWLPTKQLWFYVIQGRCINNVGLWRRAGWEYFYGCGSKGPKKYNEHMITFSRVESAAFTKQVEWDAAT
jgi:hypothetical protein